MLCTSIELTRKKHELILREAKKSEHEYDLFRPSLECDTSSDTATIFLLYSNKKFSLKLE